MIRVQEVILPILRAALPGVSVVSDTPDPEHREFPLVIVRRAGGVRNPKAPMIHTLPAIELVVVHDVGLVEAEELYEDALDALYDAVRQQITVEGVGYLHSVTETRGAAQSPSHYPDTWATEGAVRLGLRSHEKSGTTEMVPPLT